jgi:6-phospho-beta-glucosidase
MQIFDPDLRATYQTFFNEYLHYYYHRDEALAALIAKPETRGEETARLTAELLERLREAGAVKQPERGLAIWAEVMGKRGATYMAHARGDKPRPRMEAVGEDDGGYAGVALGCIEAIATGTPHYTGLNVPNNGAIEGMADDDVVEVLCRVDSSGAQPVRIGAVHEDHLRLMQSVKRYERLAVQAILKRSRLLAVEALMMHPLIGSYPLAKKLVEAFLLAHHDLIGEWQ